jgi:hypothetical protein
LSRRLFRASGLAVLVLTVGFFVAQGAGAAGRGDARYRTTPVMSASRGGGISLPFNVGKNVDVTRKNGAQSETAVAIDPTDSNHLLASSNDLSNFSSYNNVFESFDRGRTWTSAGESVAAFCYDTWLAFNNAGDAFFSYECSDQRIAYRLHGTTTWVNTKLTNAGSFPDRDMVTVDNSATSPFDGSVYIGYDDNGSSNRAFAMISRNGQGSWTRSNPIDDTPTTSDVIGNNIATGPDGTVYATWEDYANRKIKSDVSHDGGVTWGTDRTVTNFRIDTTGFFIFSIPAQASRGVLPMPMTAVEPAGSPHAGRLLVTYFDKDPSGPNTNIYFRYSDDGGATWSAETKVDDDTNHAYHFHPAIAVMPDGTIAISFYDTRNDATGKKTDQYMSFSTDGGVTWSANQRVTTAQSDETVGADANQYGDYQNMDASTNNIFYLTWTDDRFAQGAEEQFFARSKP